LSGRAKSVFRRSESEAQFRAAHVSSPRGGGYGGGGGWPHMTTVTHAVGATMMKSEVAFGLAEADRRPIEDIVVPISKKLPLVELNESTCKWPQGDPLPRTSISAGTSRKRTRPTASITRSLPSSRVIGAQAAR
jgi:GcrA cell cycle regulator